MKSKFLLDPVSEKIEDIVDVIDENSSNLEPPTRRTRGYAKADHTRTAKGIFDSIKKCDTCEHVRDIHRKLVVDYDMLEDLHDYIVFYIGSSPYELEIETTWFQRAIDVHRKALTEADRYLKPPATPTRPSSRSSNYRSTSSQRLLDATLNEQKLMLQLRQHQEEVETKKKEDEARVTLAAKQEALDAERKGLEAASDQQQKALDAAREERRITQQLEIVSLEKQVLTQQLSGSPVDELGSLDLQPPRTNAFFTTQMTPPASRLGLRSGFYVPCSDQLPAQEGDAAITSQTQP